MRYKELLNTFPHNGLPNWHVLYVLYGGLSEENKNEIGMASRGSFLYFSITRRTEITRHYVSP
jgi:hypothetical protein